MASHWGNGGSRRGGSCDRRRGDSRQYDTRRSGGGGGGRNSYKRNGAGGSAGGSTGGRQRDSRDRDYGRGSNTKWRDHRDDSRQRRQDRGGGWQQRSRSRSRDEPQNGYRQHRWSPRDGGKRYEDATQDRRASDRDRDRDRDRDNHCGVAASNGKQNGGGQQRQDNVTKGRRDTPSSSGSASSADDRSGSAGSTDEDEIIHYDWKPGQVLNGRYELTKLLGDGTFGRVVLARDKKHGRDVAIKVIRDVKRYMENAKIEAQILKDIRRADPNGASGCCLLFANFTHEAKFYCLVFETLGVSLYDFLKANRFRGFWMQDIQAFAEQSMTALTFLHSRLRMAHTDLKPENILLQSPEAPISAFFHREQDWLRIHGPPTEEVPHYVRPASNRIKLIDFGNAIYEDEHHSSIINTRQYRGPEVLLGLPWNELSDLWSIGSILMELYTGEQLFATHEELEHLALMERIIGPMPQHMMESASSTVKERYLTRDPVYNTWMLPFPERASPSSERHVFSQRPLPEQASPHHRHLTDFVGAILTLDPRRRPRAEDALNHPLFLQKYND